ncbi:MAG: hypothetical protein JJ864_07115 [Rhizobiaceae bacterium]|nr:hypothetical protein [Rhizobiaceae bacterium]
MDWALAIRRNREALSRILAALFPLVGLNDSPHPEALAEGEPRRVPRHLHAYALRILRAAESAIRRLIVIAAQDVVARPAGGTWPPSSPPQREGEEPSESEVELGQSLRIPAFPLLDPLKRFRFEPPRHASKFMPRICVVGVNEPAPTHEKPVISPDDPVDATSLCRRLLSSRRALANLPREARRLARWHQRNRLGLLPTQGRGRVSPLRIGHPPGRRKRSTHLVDDILKECQALALDVLSPADTS